MADGGQGRALVIGASGGIGGAFASELMHRGADVRALSRSADGFDITDEASIVRGLATVDGPLDVVLVATGALTSTRERPEKSLSELGRDELMAQFLLNAVGPALVLKHLVELLPRDRRSVVAILSARVGSIGDNRLGGWHSYRTSKAALNALVHGASIEIARRKPQAIVACLHPGTVATDFTADYNGHDKVSAGTAAKNLLDVVDGLKPEQTGGFFDYAGREIVW